MRDPGCQQLPKRHRAELGMFTLKRELLLADVPPADCFQAAGSQPCKLVEQIQ